MAKTYISTKIKAIVKNRAYGYCEYCQCPSDISTDTFSLEHIIPRSKNGTDPSENIRLILINPNNKLIKKRNAHQVYLKRFLPSLVYRMVRKK